MIWTRRHRTAVRQGASAWEAGWDSVSFISGPFAEGTTWLDFWDFIVSTNVLPFGSLMIALFCCNRFGWGWDRFVLEANSGKGRKVRQWMKPLFRYAVPAVILFLYIYGLVTFKWK